MLHLIKRIFIIFMLLQINFSCANDVLQQIDNFCNTKCHHANSSAFYKNFQNIDKANELICSFSKRFTCLKYVFGTILLQCLTLYYFNIDNSSSLLKTAIELFAIEVILTIIKDNYISNDYLHSFVEFYQIFFDFILPIHASSTISNIMEELPDTDVIDNILPILVHASSVSNTFLQSYYHFTKPTDNNDNENCDTKVTFLQRCLKEKKDIFIYSDLLNTDKAKNVFFDRFCQWFVNHKYENRKIAEYKNIHKENNEIINKDFNLKISKLSEKETLTDALLYSLLQKNSYLVLEASIMNDTKHDNKYQYLAIVNYEGKYFALIGLYIDSKLLDSNLQLYMKINSIHSQKYIFMIIKFDSENELFNLKKEIINEFGECVSSIDIFKFDKLIE